MLTVLKKLLLFRASQSSARGMAKVLGFGRLASLIGVFAGMRALRNYTRRHA